MEGKDARTVMSCCYRYMFTCYSVNTIKINPLINIGSITSKCRSAHEKTISWIKRPRKIDHDVKFSENFDQRGVMRVPHWKKLENWKISWEKEMIITVAVLPLNFWKRQKNRKMTKLFTLTVTEGTFFISGEIKDREESQLNHDNPVKEEPLSWNNVPKL